MITKISLISDKGLMDLTKQYLFEKQLVAIPTETVYGLAAKLEVEAISKIFEVKKRPMDNPLIVHIYDRTELTCLVTEITETQTLLMDRFWPGPLTLLFNVKKAVPKIITAGLDTIAIRCPAHPVTREILKNCGPLAAPSANLSGKPSPTTAQHVFTDLEGKIPLIIDGGPCSVGLESSVCNPLTDPPCLLRPGVITLSQLRQIKGMENCVSKFEGKMAMAPGMKYKHYEPTIPVILVVADFIDYSVLKNVAQPFAIIRDATLPITNDELHYQCIKGCIADISQTFELSKSDSVQYLNQPIAGNVEISISDMRSSLFQFLRILDGENNFPKKACIVAYLRPENNEDLYNRLSKASSLILIAC
eukprot:NODE_36_length_31474_cov_0.342438.p8 type:complete len:362 gc:universal NODE_36_length_31474_cov_0.342438:30240-31325(+)